MRSSIARLALALVLTVGAARPAAAQWRLGAYGGLNRTTVDAEELGTFADSRWGFVAGGFVESGLTASLSLRGGVQYAQKGFRVVLPSSETGEADDISFEFQVDYVELPLQLVYYLRTDGRLSGSLHGGVVPAFKATCKLGLDTGDVDASVDCGAGGPDVEVESDVKAFDFGVIGGGTLTFDLGGAQLLGGVSYTYGLTSFIDELDLEDPDVEETPGSDAEHRALGITLGVVFPLG